MGLSVSHGAWRGAYSAFMSFRRDLAAAAGLPVLNTMAGYGGNTPWESLPPDILHVLLLHSDCEGEIEVEHLSALADRLEEIAKNIPGDRDGGGHLGNVRDKVLQFARGCRNALAAGEPLDFH